MIPEAEQRKRNRKREVNHHPRLHHSRRQVRQHFHRAKQRSPGCDEVSYQGSGKLSGQVAIVTSGASGIGRAVAIAFAREGADVAIACSEKECAEDTRGWVEKAGRRCLIFAGDPCDPAFCRSMVKETVGKFGRLDILVNHAAQSNLVADPAEVSPDEVQRRLMTNLFSYFHCTTAALREMKRSSVIINTTSAIDYSGQGQLITYASTMSVAIAFTRSLARSVQKRGVRVSGVDPGPALQPMAAGAFRANDLDASDRRSQPAEMAAAYVHLASTDAPFMNGRILHLNGSMLVG
jgi:NAD(P)-dependent dehydrogenase (short-subunit alcohol dehydrogenase family)